MLSVHLFLLILPIIVMLEFVNQVKYLQNIFFPESEGLLPRRFACCRRNSSIDDHFSYMASRRLGDCKMIKFMWFRRLQNINIFFQYIENDLGITTSVLECGSSSSTDQPFTQPLHVITCPDVMCLEPPGDNIQQPTVDCLIYDDLNPPVTSFPVEQQPSTSTPQLPVKPAIPKSKTPTKKVSLTQNIQETQLEVLKKESRKLDIEIENLLLARKKLKLEMEEIEERRGSKK